MRRPSPSEIELSVGPHPARPGWRVLRVSYVSTPEHNARVVAALDVLFGGQRVEQEPVAWAEQT